MTMKPARRYRAWCLTVCLLGLLPLAACDGEKPDRAAAEAALTEFEPVLATPADAASSIIRLLELRIEARPKLGSEASKAFTEQALRIVDGDAVYKQYKAHVDKPEPRDSVLAELTRNWAPVIMNYRGCFDFDAIVGPLPSIDSLTPHVFVPATKGEERALLRVDLVRYTIEPDTWRVARLEFVPLSALDESADMPAEIPTTQPSAPPSP